MATVLPFKAIRPSKDKVHLVVTRAIEAYSDDVLNVRLRTNPYSFLHVLLPDFLAEEKFQNHSRDKSEAIYNNFQSFIDQKILIKDKESHFYVYRQKSSHGTITGLIGLADTADYENGSILKHEETLSQRQSGLADHLEACPINTEPICFFYEDNTKLESLIHTICLSEPTYDFSTVDENRHTLWKVADEEFTKRIEAGFKDIDQYYIADGHHRCASAVEQAYRRKTNNPNHKGTEDYNFMMGVFFSESELKVFSFHRLVNSLNCLSDKEFMNRIKAVYEVTEQEIYITPTSASETMMFLRDQWYQLTLKTESDKIAADILTENVLNPILGIGDIKHDNRLSFTPETKDISEIEESVLSGENEVAFSIYPPSTEQIKNLAKNNNSLPPKSTWIEPKLRSGMTVFEF
ncbi:DUF1015 domain-containing protein [Flavobacteriales bacterium]|nr:DUF1015 domain-containing protein [Flavobacteriales bacterium]